MAFFFLGAGSNSSTLLKLLVNRSFRYLGRVSDGLEMAYGAVALESRQA